MLQGPDAATQQGRHRVNERGPRSSRPEACKELPTLPVQPGATLFNPYEAVLAETHTEGWDG